MKIYIRQILLLTLFLSLYSCGQNEEIIKRDELYKKGINEMQLVVLGESTNYKKAIEYFNQSLKIDSTFTAASLIKSQCQLKSKLYNETIQTATLALEINNESSFKAPLHTILGLTYKIIGETENSNIQLNKALDIFNERLSKNINDIDAISNKSIVLCYMDKKNEAVQFLETLTLNKDNKDWLEQIRKGIQTFDTENVIQKLTIQ